MFSVTSDEEEDFCRVCVVIKGIKKPSSLLGSKAHPANGFVELDLKERLAEVEWHVECSYTCTRTCNTSTIITHNTIATLKFYYSYVNTCFDILDH